VGVQFCGGLRGRTGLGLCIQIVALAIAGTTTSTITTTSVNSAVGKLGEIGDEVLVVPARSKRKVENALHVDRFYENLPRVRRRSSVNT
jgi:hypothetical protein